MEINESRVAILTPSISRLAGGLFFSVRCISRELIQRGINVKVFSVMDKFSHEDLKTWHGIPIELYKSTMGKFCYANHIYSNLLKFQPNTVYLNGIWTYQSVLNLRISCEGIKTVIAPRGMIDGWALKNSFLQKRIALTSYEKYNFQNANLIHALCDNEAISIKKIFPKSRIQVIPNGIDIPSKKIFNIESFYGQEKPFILGYIGRLDEKKGLTDLLLAINHIRKTSHIPFIRLAIAGWGSIYYERKLKNMVIQLGLLDVVDFIGQVYGDEKEKFLNQIDAFILPSYSEGLPMAVLDSWARAIPVLMTDECNLQYSFAENAAIRITHDPLNIAEKILHLINRSPEELNAIGSRGFLIAKNKYSWKTIANSMIEMLLNPIIMY